MYAGRKAGLQAAGIQKFFIAQLLPREEKVLMRRTRRLEIRSLEIQSDARTPGALAEGGLRMAFVRPVLRMRTMCCNGSFSASTSATSVIYRTRPGLSGRKSPVSTFRPSSLFSLHRLGGLIPPPFPPFQGACSGHVCKMLHLWRKVCADGA